MATIHIKGVPNALKVRVKVAAAKAGITFRQFIMDVLEAHLKETDE